MPNWLVKPYVRQQQQHPNPVGAISDEGHPTQVRVIRHTGGHEDEDTQLR